MYHINLTTCSAIDIIKRSIVCHPSLFADALEKRIMDDNAYSAMRDDPAVKRAVSATAKAGTRALEYIRAENSDAFADDLSAGIIALNVACVLQVIPPHVRTRAAVATWESKSSSRAERLA